MLCKDEEETELKIKGAVEVKEEKI